FFTNAYMGLRAGSVNTGRFPVSRDPAFVDRCRRFLAVQLATQRPRLVLTLGSHVPSMIAALSQDIEVWSGARSIGAIDAADASVLDILVPEADNLRTVVAALIHPCLRPSSVRRRRYRGLTGEAAEVRLLADAIVMAGLTL